MLHAPVTYEELFAAAVQEAHRQHIPVFDPTPPANRFARGTDGLRLHLLDWGGDLKPPLVALHGMLTNAHVWDFFSLQLRERFHIYAVDLRGHGDSEWAADADYSRARGIKTSFFFKSKVCGLSPQGYSPWTSREECS